MKSGFSQFQDQAEQIRVTPQPQTWDRVRNRLQAHRNTRRVRHARILAFAAVLIGLVAVSAGLMFYFNWQQSQGALHYSQTIEELSSGAVENTDGIYNVERIRDYYSAISQ